MGELLGIAQQLDNDCHDLYHLLQDYISATESESTMKSGKTDLVLKKKTLPIVLAAGRDATLHENAWIVEKEIEEHRKALQEEVSQLKSEIDRIGNTTEFNTQKYPKYNMAEN